MRQKYLHKKYEIDSINYYNPPNGVKNKDVLNSTEKNKHYEKLFTSKQTINKKKYISNA